MFDVDLITRKRTITSMRGITEEFPLYDTLYICNFSWWVCVFEKTG